MTKVSYEDQNKQLCFYGRGILSLWEDCLTNSALPTNAGSGLLSREPRTWFKIGTTEIRGSKVVLRKI